MITTIGNKLFLYFFQWEIFFSTDTADSEDGGDHKDDGSDGGSGGGGGMVKREKNDFKSSLGQNGTMEDTLRTILIITMCSLGLITIFLMTYIFINKKMSKKKNDENETSTMENSNNDINNNGDNDDNNNNIDNDNSDNANANNNDIYNVNNGNKSKDRLHIVVVSTPNENDAKT